QRTLADAVACADGEFIAQKLVAHQRDRSFLEIEYLVHASRVVGEWPGRVHNSHRARAARVQDFAHHAKISARGKFLIPGEAERLETRTGNQACNGFGQDAAESLIKPGNFSGFEPDAGVVEHAPERAGPDAA